MDASAIPQIHRNMNDIDMSLPLSQRVQVTKCRAMRVPNTIPIVAFGTLHHHTSVLGPSG